MQEKTPRNKIRMFMAVFAVAVIHVMVGLSLFALSDFAKISSGPLDLIWLISTFLFALTGYYKVFQYFGLTSGEHARPKAWLLIVSAIFACISGYVLFGFIVSIWGM